MNINILFLLFLMIAFGCNNRESSQSEGTKTDGLEITEKRVFITSQKYDGNLNGVSGANSKCLAVARAAGLTRTYKAFLSSSTSDAINNFSSVSGSIYELDENNNKILVTDSLNDFNSGSFYSDPGLKFDENGIDLNDQYGIAVMFWIATGTDASEYCSDWTSNLNSENGDLGSTNSSEIINWGNPDNCSNPVHLICISD